MILSIFLLIVFCFSVIALIGCTFQSKKVGIKLWSIVAVFSLVFNLPSMNFPSLIIGIVFGVVAFFSLMSARNATNQSSFMKTGKRVITAICALFAIAGLWGGFVSKQMNAMPTRNEKSSNSDLGGYEQLGHKINKHNVKENKDGDYYIDKVDNNIRYFTDDDGTITAIKYNYMPNPKGSTSVTSELANLLDDSHLKYGNDKVSDDKTLLKGDNYNVYSPKHKKWYHMSMQKDDNGKVSTFSVWPSKDSDAE